MDDLLGKIGIFILFLLVSAITGINIAVLLIVGGFVLLSVIAGLISDASHHAP